MIQLDKQEILYELELLDRFIQQLYYERLRRTSTNKQKSDDCESLLASFRLAITEAIRKLTS